MLYTPKVRAAVRSIPSPHQFEMEVFEYSNFDPKFIGLRFKESQWAYYTEAERYDCLMYLEKVREVLTGFGIASTLEPYIDTGETLPEKYKRGYGR